MYITVTVNSECGKYQLHAFKEEDGAYNNPMFEFEDKCWDNGEWLYRKMWKKLKKGKSIKDLPDADLPEILEMFKEAIKLGFFGEYIINKPVNIQKGDLVLPVDGGELYKTFTGHPYLYRIIK